MLGFIAGAIAGGWAVWHYRGSHQARAQGGASPIREKLDEILEAVQDKAERLLDQTKDRVSSRLERSRARVRGAVSESEHGRSEG